jgi:hypothetical protein
MFGITAGGEYSLYRVYNTMYGCDDHPVARVIAKDEKEAVALAIKHLEEEKARKIPIWESKKNDKSSGWIYRQYLKDGIVIPPANGLKAYKEDVVLPF